MDLNLLLERNRLALMLQEKAGSDEERRAYRHFARDCSAPKPVTGNHERFGKRTISPSRQT